jgi:hypothetical protein
VNFRLKLFVHVELDFGAKIFHITPKWRSRIYIKVHRQSIIPYAESTCVFGDLEVILDPWAITRFAMRWWYVKVGSHAQVTLMLMDLARRTSIVKVWHIKATRQQRHVYLSLSMRGQKPFLIQLNGWFRCPSVSKPDPAMVCNSWQWGKQVTPFDHLAFSTLSS